MLDKYNSFEQDVIKIVADAIETLNVLWCCEEDDLTIKSIVNIFIIYIYFIELFCFLLIFKYLIYLIF